MNLLLLFGFGNSKVKEALQHDAVIIDVRTAYEFDQGKVPNSINIPIDRIAANAERIKQIKKPVVFCCASGMHSATATRIMKEKGLKDVYNGGSWQTVLKIINKL